MEIEDVLEPGERLLWEGRPVGYRTSLRILGFYLAFAVLVLALPITLIVRSVKDYPFWWIDVRSWEHTVTGSTLPLNQSGFGSMIVYSYSFDDSGPLLYLGFVVATILGTELYRVARRRARRYGITDRRVLATNGKKVDGEIDRADVTRARVEGRDLVVECSQFAVRFESLEDPEAARSALSAGRDSEAPSTPL